MNEERIKQCKRDIKLLQEELEELEKTTIHKVGNVLLYMSSTHHKFLMIGIKIPTGYIGEPLREYTNGGPIYIMNRREITELIEILKQHESEVAE